MSNNISKSKKELLMYVVLFVVLLFSSNLKQYAQSAAEIKEITAIRTMGIDRSENGKILVTMVIKTAKNETYTEKQEGDTIFEAIRNAQKETLKMPYWGHVDNILIGEKAARNGIAGYLDFFLREHQFKMDIKVQIVRNIRATDFIEQTSSKESFLSDRLNVLQSANKAHSTSGVAKLSDIGIKLEQKFSGLFIPTVEIKEQGKKIELSNYAVFANTKLIGYLSDEESLGLNILNNTFGSKIVVAKDSEDNKVSLEILKVDAKESLIFIGDKPKMKYKIDISSGIGEYMGKKQLKKELLDSFESQQKNEIQKYVNSIILFSKTNGIDGIGLFDAINYWESDKITESENIFIKYLKDIDMQIEVNPKIERTFLISTPIGGE